MSKELAIFKNTNKEKFFVFFDDQNADGFWNYCFNINGQSKNGYTFTKADGDSAPIVGHLGGFIRYLKK